MNKAVPFLALLGAATAFTAGSACAQTQATLFGVVDAGFARVWAAGTRVDALSNSGNSYSRLGIRASEDLGSGLTASFWIEGQLFTDTGAANSTGFSFNRRSTVSLLGPLGELRLGRGDAATYTNPAWFDPFQGAGIGQPTAYSMLGAPIRVSNAVSYFLPPNLGGFYGQAQVAFGEALSSAVNNKLSDYWGVNLGYTNKTLNVAAATGTWHNGTATVPANVHATNAAISYKFAGVTPMAFWAREKNSAGVQIDALLVGAAIPVGAGEIRVAYSRYDRKNSENDWNKLSLGYVHNFSRRTAVYGTYARIHNSGASAQVVASTGIGAWPSASPLPNVAGASSGGIEFGIRHSF